MGLTMDDGRPVPALSPIIQLQLVQLLKTVHTKVSQQAETGAERPIAGFDSIPSVPSRAAHIRPLLPRGAWGTRTNNLLR
jgi:hypothetical protein